jgi:hypothetical protein
MIIPSKRQEADYMVWKGTLMEIDAFSYDEDAYDNNRYERETAYEEREAWFKSNPSLRFL